MIQTLTPPAPAPLYVELARSIEQLVELWVEMPPGVDMLRLHREALKQRINTAPGAMFSVKDRYRNCLRMNCGVPWTQAIEAAIRTLGDLAKRQL
ncbi:MAG: hypothetical protein HY736_20815 [Verrucomicrobia bacterium]|nr:hypothetical protein [Verrucomicrobiota bacterium]